MDIRSKDTLAKYIKTAQAYKDGLGLKMDPGIVRTVALLNALGFETQASCEGHMDPHHGEIMPWITINTDHSKKKEDAVRRLVRSYWQYRMPAQVPQALALWIDELDAHKKDGTVGALRIQIGLDFLGVAIKHKSKMPEPVRAWLLAQGKKEMKAFTKYLELVYSGQLKVLKNPPAGIHYE
jgi:hypothetical protein